MLLARREPDHIARIDLLDWTALSLCPSMTSGHDQSLTQRVSVPRSPGTRLERDVCTHRSPWSSRFKQRINSDGAGKILGGSLAGGLSATSFDFHISCLCLGFK